MIKKMAIVGLMFSTASAYAGSDLTMTCGTAGEGLDLEMSIGQVDSQAKLKVSYPDGNSKSYEAEVGNSGVYDLLFGNQSYLIGETEKTVKHGGTITDSILLVVDKAENQETPKRSAVASVGGKTYILDCTLEVNLK